MSHHHHHHHHHQSSLVAVVLIITVMCYFCGLISSWCYENVNLCDSSDPRGRCSGSDSNGLCSPDNFTVAGGSGGAVEFQAGFLDGLGVSDLYDNGKSSGCVKLDRDPPPPVYTYYCCDRYVDGCEDCYANAIKRLKDGCSGRAGGSVLFDKCSLRYELYNFCNK